METLQRTANRGSISTGYDIDNSLKLEADNSERLYFTPSSSGNRKTWTFSCWFKITEADKYCMLMGTADTYMYIDQYGGDLHVRLDGSNYLYTTPVYRDTSAWYHFVLAVDTTQATAANRAKIYVNGEQVTDFATEVYPAQNADTDWNFTNAHYVGGWTSSLYDSSGYIAEVHSVDGQQLAPTEFGEVDSDSGIWKPKEYTGTYGTNGFYLEFENSADLGDDTSGNNKNFVLQNITSADQATDTPTNNFAIYNQLIPKDEFIIYEGGTRSKKTTATRWRTFASTLAVANGKWYAEFQNSLYSATGTNRMVGVAPASIFTETSASTGGYLGGSSTETTDSIGFYSTNGRYYINGNSYVWGNSWTADEIIGVALDMDNGYVYFSIDGTWQNSGDPTSGSSGTGGIALQLPNEAHYIAGSIYNSNAQLEVNYGGYTVISISSGNADANGYGNFEYATPSGYYALCTKNLAEFG